MQEVSRTRRSVSWQGIILAWNARPQEQHPTVSFHSIDAQLAHLENDIFDTSNLGENMNGFETVV